MRLVVARCEVVNSGRLTATLPDALRLFPTAIDSDVGFRL